MQCRFNPDRDVRTWKGTYRPYDIVKEAFAALLAVGVLILLLTVVFSSPDEAAVTLKTWSTNNPVDFAQTATTELDGTSAVATYGPPYCSCPTSPSTSVSSSPRNGSSAPADRYGAGLCHQTAPHVAESTECPASAQCVQSGLDVSAGRLDDELREGGSQRLRHPRSNHVPVGPYGPIGVMISSLTSMRQVASMALCSARDSSTTRTTPSHCCSSPTVTTWQTSQAHNTFKGSQWGMMNETGQLSRPSVALALHGVLSGPTDEHVE